MTPVISIIVAVYKAESCLRRCVDSLLAQTFQDYEILLVDDEPFILQASKDLCKFYNQVIKTYDF